MATAAQIIERLAPLAGMLPSTLDRQLRAQRAVGQIPTAGRGGGKNSAHFDAQHITNVLLGLVGQQPSDAPEAAQTFYALPYLKVEGLQAAKAPVPGSDLGSTLVTMLNTIAIPLSKSETHENRYLRWVDSWRIVLSLNAPPYVTITTGVITPEKIVYTFGDDSPELESAVVRWTNLSGKLFFVAAQLLADTYAQQQSAPTNMFPKAPKPAKASASKEKNAGHLRQEVPAPISDQPRTNETGGLPALPEAIRENQVFQGKHRRRQAASSRKKEPTSA